MKSQIEKLQRKPILLLSIIAILSVIIIGWNVFAIVQIDLGLGRIVQQSAEAIELDRAQIFLLKQEVVGQEYLLTGNTDFLVQHKEFETLADFHLTQAQRFQANAADATLITEIRADQGKYLTTFTEIVRLYEQGNLEQAKQLSLGEAEAVIQTAHDQIESFISQIAQELQAEVAATNRLTQLSLIISLGLLIVLLAIAYIALSIDNRVLRPIFLLAVIISLVVVGWDIYNIWQLDAEVQQVIRHIEEVDAIEEMEVFLLQQEVSELDYLLTGDETYVTRHRELEVTADQYLTQALALQTTPEEMDLLTVLKQDHDQYEQLFNTIVTTYQQGDQAEALRLSVEEASVSLEDIQQRVEAFVDQAEIQLERQVAQIDQLATGALTIGVFTLIILAVEAVIATAVTAQVLNPVNLLIRATQAIENETYDTQVLDEVATRQDEMGNLARMFQHMSKTVYARTRQLKEQVQKLRIEIDQVKREREVSEIVESDFFQDLQSKANTLRNRRTKPTDDE